MDKWSKHDTILWINHAISFYESQGKKQKQLARELGIEESRISELKIGKGTISPNLKEKIVELCGAPRRNPGRFENAEVYADFQSFKDRFNDISKNRFIRRLIRQFKVKGCMENIHNNCHRVEGDKILSRRPEIHEVEAIMDTEHFNNLCINYAEWLKEGHRDNFKFWNDPSGRALVINNIAIIEREVFHALYLAWQVKQVDMSFNMVDCHDFNLQPLVKSEPIILTGKKVLVIRDVRDAEPLINKPIIDEHGKCENYGRKFNLDHCTKLNYENCRPDYWKSVLIELYLSENMNFHLVIHLSPNQVVFNPDWERYGEAADMAGYCTYISSFKEEDRLAVIENINTLELFDVIEDARKWAGQAEVSHYEVKKQIALAGGYITGARVLM